MRILIATTRAPRPEMFGEACRRIREAAELEGARVTSGIRWTDGPGCANVAMEVEGSDEDCGRFADRLTITLVPAKWGVTPDDLPAEDAYSVTAFD